MNSIVIKNKGQIVAEDLMLIGSSTKREQTNKIGMFGSGWKYALAWFLRNDIPIRVYSGKEQIAIGVKEVNHRNNIVNVITIAGRETSLTTDMGPQWTGWMALREVISNAIDEGQHSIDVIWKPQIEPVDGETIIEIPTNNELAEVMMKFEHYFAFDRKTKFEYPQGKVYLKVEKTPVSVYRKGIRCFDDSTMTSYMDFNFNEIDINESRLTQSWDVRQAARNLLSNPNLHAEVLLAALKTARGGWLPRMNDRVLELLQQLHAAGQHFHTDAILVMMGPGAVKEGSLPVPGEWFKEMSEHGLIENPFSNFGDDFNFIRTDLFPSEGIKYYLKAIRCDLDVQVGKFDSTMIDVKVKGRTAYVSEECRGDDSLTAAKIIKTMDANDIALILSK